MRARHRLSKLLLRQGIVYSGGHAWTGAHDVWLRAAPRSAFATAAAGRSTPPTTRCWPPTARRDRLDAAIAAMAADSEFTPVVRRLGCLRGVSTLTGFGAGRGDRRLAPVHRPHDRRLPRAGAHRVLLRAARGRRGRSPRPATATPAGCWSRRPGTTASPTATGTDHARPLGRWPTRPRRARGQPATTGCTSAGSGSPTAKKRPVVANVAIARELAGWCWSLAVTGRLTAHANLIGAAPLSDEQ